MEEEGPVNSRLCSTSRLYPAASGQTRTRKRTGTSPQRTPPTEGGMMLSTLADKKKEDTSAADWFDTRLCPHGDHLSSSVQHCSVWRPQPRGLDPTLSYSYCEEAAAGCSFIFVTDSHNKFPLLQFDRSPGVSRVLVSKQLVEQTKENTLRPTTRHVCCVVA